MMIKTETLAALPGISHGFFTRQGGVSAGIFASRNCGFGSGDRREAVAENRRRSAEELGEGAAPALVTVYQTHGIAIVSATAPWEPEAAPRADAMVTDRPGLALGILTADCAPVLFADSAAGVIGAAHAGWRGALAGVIEATVEAMRTLGAEPSRILAAIGPCIGRASYEVGSEFWARFVADAPANQAFFTTLDGAAGEDGKSFFDLGGYVAGRLAPLGLAAISLSSYDTAAAEDLFYSYRRSVLRGENEYGRQLSAIALVG